MAIKVGGVRAHRPIRAGASPGGPAHGDVGYHGGPLLSCPEIHPAFWGTLWSDQTHQLQAQRLVQFLRDLVNSSWMNVISQYGGGTGAGSGTVASESFVATLSGTLSDKDIHHALQSEINNGVIPEPPARNTSEVVIIFLDESLAVKDSSTAVMCEATGDNAFGYHFGFKTSAGNQCYYAVIPPLDDACIVNTCPCQNQIAHNKTSAGPLITADNWVYFRGTDDRLWKVQIDGTGQQNINNNKTKSTPFVTHDGWVWFQGTDDKLFKVFNDGTQQSQPGNNKTSSSPIVVNNLVYFRGTDDKLFQMNTDGSGQINLGGNKTSSTQLCDRLGCD